jgi:hypothetical protein
MNAAVNRRVFVASVVAGLPTLVGAAHDVAAPASRGHDHATAEGDADAVLEHVVQEMAAVHSRGSQRGYSGEHARAIAAQLRTAAVRGGQLGIDAAATRGVQQLIRRRGRDAVLTIDIDTAKARAQMKRYGIEIDDRWFGARTPDHATRAKALDVLLSGGITDMLTHAAGVFDKLGSVLDVRAGAVARARHAQSDPLWWSFCWGLLTEIMMLMAQLGPICEASGAVPGLDVTCAALEAAMSAYFGIYYGYCQ